MVDLDALGVRSAPHGDGRLAWDPRLKELSHFYPVGNQGSGRGAGLIFPIRAVTIHGRRETQISRFKLNLNSVYKIRRYKLINPQSSSLASNYYLHGKETTSGKQVL